MLHQLILYLQAFAVYHASLNGYVRNTTHRHSFTTVLQILQLVTVFKRGILNTTSLKVQDAWK